MLNGRTERREALQQILRRLEQCPTVAPFTRTYYRYVYGQLGAVGPEGDKLRQAFLLLLRCQWRRHEAVSGIIRLGRPDLPRMVRIGVVVQSLLQRLESALTALEPAHPRDAMLRELLLADCAYNLGRTDLAIQALRTALELGARHAVVHFALGYNLYCSALLHYTRPGERKGELFAADPLAFEMSCNDALVALRDGLREGQLDGQLHWWIGLIKEVLGDARAAGRSYREARTADPENFSELVSHKLAYLAQRSARRSQRDRARLARLPAIEAPEMAEFLRTLEECSAIPQFMLPEEAD